MKTFGKLFLALALLASTIAKSDTISTTIGDLTFTATTGTNIFTITVTPAGCVGDTNGQIDFSICSNAVYIGLVV